MHDRTAEKIARVTSHIPYSAATIVPFDVTARVHGPQDHASHPTDPVRRNSSRDSEPAGPSGRTTDDRDTVNGRGRREVLGRVHSVRIKPVGQSSILACTITDQGGEMTALFYGRTHIPGIAPGTSLRLRGQATRSSAGPVMINPAYELTDERLNGGRERRPQKDTLVSTAELSAAMAGRRHGLLAGETRSPHRHDLAGLSPRQARTRAARNTQTKQASGRTVARLVISAPFQDGFELGQVLLVGSSHRSGHHWSQRF